MAPLRRRPVRLRLGEDAGSLAEAERHRWREQGRHWLRVDLAACRQVLDDNPSVGCDLVRCTLRIWRSESDLTAVRETGELAKLPADEQKEWLAFWANIAV